MRLWKVAFHQLQAPVVWSWEEFKRRMHDKKWLASQVREKLIEKKSEVDFLEDVLDNLEK